jgi:hypothetical protein
MKRQKTFLRNIFQATGRNVYFNITNLLNFESNVSETMSYWDVTPLQVKPIYTVVSAKKICM